jgi:8-oxo-dGTP pyrophosphatase MutT (NUDIX family)
MTVFIQNIKDELKKDLPGLSFQAKMAPVSRLDNYNPNPEGARKGGVLLLLYYKNSKLQITFIRRAKDGGAHSGQIAFPGGKFEESDKTIIETAKRETFEEIGVDSKQLEILGSLTTLYIPVSNYIVHPVVGFIRNMPKFVANENEVSEIIVSPLDFFLDEKNIENGEIKLELPQTVSDFRRIKTPFYKFNENIVWGATAMIMSEFSEIVRRVVGAE